MLREACLLAQADLMLGKSTQLLAMRKIEAQTIKAVQTLAHSAHFSGDYLKAGNTIVGQEHTGIAGTIGYCRSIYVKLHGHEIATFYPAIDTFVLRDCGWQTATTKSRMNALLSAFCPGSVISAKNFDWYCNGELWEGDHTFSVVVAKDNYTLRLAAKLAG
jgi:hypothetical protein